MWRTVDGIRWCAAVLLTGVSSSALAEGPQTPQLSFASTINVPYGSYQLVYTAPANPEHRAELLGIESQVSIAHLTNFDVFQSPLHDVKFSAQSDARDDWHSLRYGMRVDMDLPSSGRFYLNVGASRDVQDDHQSYRMAVPGLTLDSGQRPWALGFFVESSGGGFIPRLDLAPQLSFRLDRLMRTRTPIDVTVQYSSWSGAPDGERAIQATFSANF